MKNFTFRQYKRSPKSDPKDDASDSKDKDSAAYLKRREQVRRAQRTHRERKENYIKSLENEVLQLRTNEAKILQENRSLQQEVGRLRQLLDQNGIPHTVGTDDFLPTATLYSSGPESTSSISVFSNPNHQQQLHIGTDTNFYLTESEESQLSASSSALKQKRSFFRRRGRSESESNDGSSVSGVGLSEADIATVAQSAANMNLRDMNQTDLGMEFVLTLEAPCLHHTQGDPNNPHEPSGHALTASAPLLYQSPEQPVDTHTEATPFGVHHHQWEAPQLSLEKLLELSSSFDLTDELTPVQAWNQIRSHPDFENLEVGTLRGLTQDILKEVKCYGFGAVIDEEIFLGLLAKTFPGVQFTGLAV